MKVWNREGKGSRRERSVGRYRNGGLTIEASWIVPMILFCMAAIMISGMRHAGGLAQEIHVQQAEWIDARSEAMEFPLILRGGTEAQELIGNLRQGG